MAATIQIRNVPEAVSRRLKAEAASRGQSLSDYLLEELGAIARRPSREEVLRRLEQLGPVDVPDAAVTVESVRTERDQHLLQMLDGNGD